MRVADSTTRPFGFSDSFSTMANATISGENVAFWGFVPSFFFPSQVLAAEIDGTLQVLVDERSTIPGQGFRQFDSFPSADFELSGEQLVFTGSDILLDGTFETGIYSVLNDQISVVADNSVTVPGGVGNFVQPSDLSQVSLDQENIAFLGHDSDGNVGIYLSSNAALQTIADESTQVPGSALLFTRLAEPSVDGTNVSFWGIDEVGQSGIYLNRNGVLETVVETGDRIDGKTVDQLSVGNEALSGDQLAFHASFDDGSEGIYLASVVDNLLGDINRDGVTDDQDIDALASGVRNGLSDQIYDVNSDGHVDLGDHSYLVRDVYRTWIGDANLDSVFDSADLVQVSGIGEYEDGLPGNSTWSEGDWDANGDFDSGDLVAAFQDGGYEVGPRRAVAVPEPLSVTPHLLAIVLLITGCRSTYQRGAR